VKKERGAISAEQATGNGQRGIVSLLAVRLLLLAPRCSLLL
jgi:hypothetical protein